MPTANEEILSDIFLNVAPQFTDSKPCATMEAKRDGVLCH